MVSCLFVNIYYYSKSNVKRLSLDKFLKFKQDISCYAKLNHWGNYLYLVRTRFLVCGVRGICRRGNVYASSG